ncbi:MAG: ABC transporter substrate-binding protein [Fimbriimonadales bacterium]|nr:ABC transporter substrate-binding protein [Fimbriimonadales bacterium]
MLKRKPISTVLWAAALAGLVAAGCGGPKPEQTSQPSESAPPAEGGSANRPQPTAAGNKAEGDTLKIGIVVPINGDQKPWGDDALNGAQIALEDFNRQGGIAGKKIELLIGDSGSNTEQAKSAAEKLISDGVLGIIGDVTSSSTIQIAKSAFEKGVPVISIGATNDDVTKQGANIFRVCYIDTFQGQVMAEFAYKDLGLRNVALMTDRKQAYSVGLSNSFRKHFEQLGGKIVGEEFYETKQTTFTGQLTNLKAKNPDGLFLSGYFPEVGPIVKSAKAAGLNVVPLGGDGWDSKEILNSGGEAVVGGVFCNHYNNKDTRPQVQHFLKRWREKVGGIPGTTMAALGYDAMAVMLDALKRSKSFDSKSLTEAIEATENFPAVSGDITLKGTNGNPIKRALVVEVRPLPEGFVMRKAIDPKDIGK